MSTCTLFSSHLVVGLIPDVATLHFAKHSDEAGDKGLNDGCLSLVQEWLQSCIDDISMSVPAQLSPCLRKESHPCFWDFRYTWQWRCKWWSLTLWYCVVCRRLPTVCSEPSVLCRWRKHIRGHYRKSEMFLLNKCLQQESVCTIIMFEKLNFLGCYAALLLGANVSGNPTGSIFICWMINKEGHSPNAL